MSDSGERRFELMRIYCHASAVVVIAMACLVLCGWALNIEYLKAVIPGLVTMKANTASCLALLAISLLLLLPGESRNARGRIARLIALLVELISVASLSEYFFRVNLGIDELLIRDLVGSKGTSAPGRMAPMTATGFIAIGLALILLDWETRRGRRPAQVLSLWAGFIAMLAISGYLYRATALTRILLYTQVAVHTAIGLLLLSSAVFLARPRNGIAGDLTRDGAGSSMARRIFPAVFLVPACLGWLRLRGQLIGLYGTEMGVALFATSDTIVFAVVVWWSAKKLNREFDHRSSAEAGMRKLNAELEERVADRTRSLEQQTIVLAEQAEQIAHLAEHDFLTGLPNRMLLNDRISQAIALSPRHGTKVALLFLDLNGFKQINDSLGHRAGDELLQSIAKRLQSSVRRTDTVCRHGGDEFVVLLSEVQRTEDAARLACQILESVAEPHFIDGQCLNISGSIGISLYPDDGADAASLLENADSAMYEVKGNGRQGYKFFASTARTL